MTHENGTENPQRTSPPNYNGTRDYGCFQVNSVHLHTKGWTSLDQIYDPSFNAQIAYTIYQSRGWRAWYSVQGILWE